MALYRVADLEIDPQHLDAYRQFLAEEIEASVAVEEGVLFLFAVSVAGQPNLVRVFEGYASQQAYESHLQSPHFLKYKSATTKMVVSLQLAEVNPICMRAKGLRAET